MSASTIIGDGKTALLVKISSVEDREFLIESDEQRYYRPAYFGDGWIGIRLDLGDTRLGRIADWLARTGARRRRASSPRCWT